ncbi:putative cation-transporting ATPase 1, partial [Linderina pennispora]
SPPQDKLVLDRGIVAATLHRRLPLFQHAYIWPFTFVYPAWLYIYTMRYEEYLGSQEFTFLSLMLVIMAQALVFLMCQWSIDMRARLTCQRVEDPYEAELVKVIAAKHLGKSAMCAMDFGINVHDETRPQLSFLFQALKYIYDEDKRIFSPVTYPSDSKPPLGELQKSVGLSGELAIKEALETYGANKFLIPIPTFVEL